MEKDIINKVASSSLKVFDLEELYPTGIRTQIDISLWLFEGFILKEKDFRDALKLHDWSQYQNHYVALHCATEAIIPAWANILITTYLIPFAKKVIVGTIEELDSLLYQEILSKVDYSEYTDKPIILKGCSKKPVPKNAYLLAMEHLQPIAKSIMFGEACSAVPLFKAIKQ